MSELIDFSNCPVNPLKWFDGANGNKISICYQGADYMLKFAPHKQKDAAQPYTNSCVSEYLSCHILQSMGLNAQDTLLGTYAGKEVVACKDFTSIDSRLQSFATLKNATVNGASSGYGTELEEVLSTIESQNIFPTEELLAFFWDTFVADALLGNFDRHNGNWGFLVYPATQIVTLAPIYDCGSCLYPQLTEAGMAEVLANPDMVHDRVFVFPNSALKSNSKKINYFTFLTTTEDKDCLQAIKRIVPKVTLPAIFEIINATPSLTDIERQFYSYMIEQRYEHILVPALERAHNLNKEHVDSLEQRCLQAKEQSTASNKENNSSLPAQPLELN